MLLGLCAWFCCFDFRMLRCVVLVGRLVCMGFRVWVCIGIVLLFVFSLGVGSWY